MTNIAVKLADSLKSFGVGAVYGAPIDLDGNKVIPVALVQFGFGGGGNDDDNGDSGLGGGGGGGYSIPIGAYVTNDEEKAEFQPNIISLVAVSVPFILASGWALAKIIRALKK
jgi:uncharacterized spore protein YtfJ